VEQLQSALSDSNEPTIPDPPTGGVDPDSLAAKEEQAVNSKSEDLLDAWQGKAKTNAIKRDEWLRHCFFGAVGIIILFGGLLLMFAMAVWAVHVMGPHDWRWLTQPELDKLQVLMFGGVVSSMATVIGKRVIGQS
jgi:hypothetical protein